MRPIILFALITGASAALAGPTNSILFVTQVAVPADFATIGSSGKVITKKDLLRDFESFHDKLESFENGPMDVQVFGNVAVAHASVTEKRSRDGKGTSGEFVWMDLLEKRAGKWVVVRSAGARVK